MAINNNLEQFAGKRVVDYQADEPLADPENTIPRLRVDYDAETDAAELLRQLLDSGVADRLTGLVVGQWSSDMYDNPPAALLETLVAAADQLPSLRALFLGDMTYEENEISWIYQTDVSPLWQAFPLLEFVGFRGSNGLSLGKMQMNHLRELTIESGGLPKSVLAEISAAHLPVLEHLELYLGTDEYGWDGTVEDLAPILSGSLFPRLRYLGLRDSQIADEVAKAVAASPLLERIEVLDLSLGTLGDEGAEALLAAPSLARLKRLNLSHHYLSDAMMERFRKLGIEVDLSDQQEEEEYGRYVSVSE